MGEPITYPDGPTGSPCLAVVDLTRLGEVFGTYAMAFLESGHVLFRTAVLGQSSLDTAFIPAAYNVRHGVELLIKQLALHLAYEARDRKLLPKRVHGLRPLWDRIRAELGPQRDPEVTTAQVDLVEQAVCLFEKLDMGGTTLRYPVGLFSEAEPLTPLDDHPLVDMREWMDRSAHLMDAASALLWAAQCRTDALRIQRGQEPVPLADLIQGPWASWTLGS